MDTQHTATRSRVERRYWRRTHEPRGWWPWGLLPLLGLLLLFLWGAFVTAPHIESDVETSVATLLRATGIDVSDVDAGGQGVTISARAPASEATQIRALARSNECDTWAGELTCPTTVKLALSAPLADATLVAAPADIERPHDFEFIVADRGITLTGEVATEVERQRIAGLAALRFGKVSNRLTVSRDTATQFYPRAADRALAVLDKLARGHATWTQGVFSAGGLATAPNAELVRAAFSENTERLTLGDLDIQVAQDAASCNEDFRRALTASTIRFRTSSAVIDQGNDDLLKQLAQLAQQCPGQLIVEGHTDDRGDAAMNQALSLSRATAVREALIALGVDASRLISRGYGEGQPIADNETPQGRARNRRIVIAIDAN